MFRGKAHSGNPNPQCFLKSIAGTNGRRIAVQVGGILQCKLEVYCGVALWIRQGLSWAGRAQRYKWGRTAVQLGDALYFLLVDVSDIFYFFVLGRGEGGIRGVRKGGVRFLLKIPGGGGEGEGPGGCLAGIWGGGGGKYFFSGPKFPPRFGQVACVGASAHCLSSDQEAPPLREGEVYYRGFGVNFLSQKGRKEFQQFSKPLLFCVLPLYLLWTFRKSTAFVLCPKNRPSKRFWALMFWKVLPSQGFTVEAAEPFLTVREPPPSR